MNFPAWQLFLKTLPQKCWPQYLGNYTDNTDGTYTYLGNYTDGTKWDCIHKYVYETEKYLLLNSYRYFAVLIHYQNKRGDRRRQ